MRRPGGIAQHPRLNRKLLPRMVAGGRSWPLGQARSVMSEALTNRALRHVQDHGPSTPAELSRAVFGGSGFVGLLPQIAGSRLRFDGERWYLPQPGQEIAFLQLLTSGPNPKRHRLVEVAAARGDIRFHAVISGPPLPASLRKLGLPAELEDARPVDQVQADLRQLLAGCTVVGFALPSAFLDRLLGPAWPAVDVLGALLALTTFGGRPDPLHVAKHFGLAAPKNRRPEELLRLAQGVHAALLEQHGSESLRREGLPRPASATVPAQTDNGPGVYVMANAAGDPLYVGKSVSLRRRVQSYLSSPIAETRGLYHLLPMTTAIEIIPVQDGLQALLLEAALIGRWQPRYNTQRQRRAGPCYLRLTSAEAFPRITLAHEPVADGSSWFGPFRHATAALRLRDLVAEVLRLRTCTRSLPAARKPRPACSLASSGRCLAPCIPGPPLAPYDSEVNLARQLLGADASTFCRLLLALLRERPPSDRRAHLLKLKFQRLRHSVAYHDQCIVRGDPSRE